MLKRLIERAEFTPPGQRVLSSGRWHETQLEEKRFPRREELDAALPNHPVMIQRGGHNIVVNSRAFQSAGIGDDVPNPVGGTYVRDPNTGRLTGHVIDAAMRPLRAQVPQPTQAELEAALRALQAQYNAAGLASVLEPGLEPREMAAFRALRERNELSVRVNMMWRSQPGFDEASLPSSLDAIASGAGLAVITLLGFIAGRRPAPNLSEWTVAGKHFGSVTLWFLQAGEIFTTYTFPGIAGLTVVGGVAPLAVVGLGCNLVVVGIVESLLRVLSPRQAELVPVAKA